jgi:hypothetical protein
MAEMDKPVPNFEPARKPDILRAKDIIPVRSRPAGEKENVNPVDIPRFDLANDIMAQQRRITAFRRKGPASEVRGLPDEAIAKAGQTTEDRRQRTPLRPVGYAGQAEDRFPLSDFGRPFTAQSYTSRWDPILADIVTRDIERLCGHG